jgi:hypothetical protein
MEFARSLEALSRDLPVNLERIVRRLAAGELGRVRDEALVGETERLRSAVRSLVAAVAGGALTLAGVLLIGMSAGGLREGVGLAGAAIGTIVLIHALWQGKSNG